MRYDYICHDCTKGEKHFVFIVAHGMNEKPKVECPKCHKTHTEKTFTTVPEAYIRGYGYLDVKGRRRDMNLYKLQTDDPYAAMRPPGEKDDLAQKIRKGGKHNPKAKSFFTNSKNSLPKKGK